MKTLLTTLLLLLFSSAALAQSMVCPTDNTFTLSWAPVTLDTNGNPLITGNGYGDPMYNVYFYAVPRATMVPNAPQLLYSMSGWSTQPGTSVYVDPTRFFNHYYVTTLAYVQDPVTGIISQQESLVANDIQCPAQ